VVMMVAAVVAFGAAVAGARIGPRHQQNVENDDQRRTRRTR
jgi:hypothetical protein